MSVEKPFRQEETLKKSERDLNIVYSIAIIIPYFGKWPKWIDLFFDSVKCNPTVDFYFYTDCPIAENVKMVSNIYITNCSFEKYCDLVSNCLSINFHPSSPYKLCDLKPFYGFIHKDVLRNYDFWGFGDLDLVYGNIRKFYTDEFLARYDVVSNHFDKISGHLALFRNNDFNRNSCFMISNWREKLVCERNLTLDEADFTYVFFPASKLSRKLYRWIWKYINWNLAWKVHTKLMKLISQVDNLDNKRVSFVERNIHPTWSGSNNWIYISGENGKTCEVWDVDKNEECVYCHFLPYKKLDAWRIISESIPLSGRIKITQNGIYE